jgi:hypothetical protein
MSLHLLPRQPNAWCTILSFLIIWSAEAPSSDSLGAFRKTYLAITAKKVCYLHTRTPILLHYESPESMEKQEFIAKYRALVKNISEFPACF